MLPFHSIDVPPKQFVGGGVSDIDTGVGYYIFLDGRLRKTSAVLSADIKYNI